MNLSLPPPACNFGRFLLGLPLGVIDLALDVSSTCCSALFSAVAPTGSLPLRSDRPVSVAFRSLCVRFPVIVGGVLLLGGDIKMGVCASS